VVSTLPNSGPWVSVPGLNPIHSAYPITLGSLGGSQAKVIVGAGGGVGAGVGVGVGAGVGVGLLCPLFLPLLLPSARKATIITELIKTKDAKPLRAFNG
jgi:hypothetical protein